jgi:membrane protein YdbS with pleckstrin-like domain
MLSALHQSPRDYLKLAMDFLIRHEGRELGPYSESEIRSRLIAGAIDLSDLCLPAESSEWTPLSSFAQFATSYREPAAPPPVPPVVAQIIPSPPPVTGLDPKSLGSYTAATLQANERPLHHTTIHWMALIPSVFGAGLALIFIGPIAMLASWKGFYVAWLLLVVPVGILLAAAVGVKTSELVITDRRVLIKVGFIRRHTFEMFISKIESVAVYQGMMGRIFDYGTVEIRGTGGSSESFATIAAPLQFRDAIQLVQSDSERH